MPREFVVTKNSDIQDQITRMFYDPEASFNLPGYSLEDISRFATYGSSLHTLPTITTDGTHILDKSLYFSNSIPMTLRFQNLLSMTGDLSSNDLSVEFFIKFSDYSTNPSGYEYLFLSTTNPGEFSVSITNSSFGLGQGKLLIVLGGGLIQTSNTVLVPDTWYHVAIIVQRSEVNPVRIFLNGVLDLANGTPPSPFGYSASSLLQFGSTSGYNYWEFNLCGFKFKKKAVVAQGEASYEYLKSYKLTYAPLIYSVNGPISLRGKGQNYNLTLTK
jgi:hypothetical protein